MRALTKDEIYTWWGVVAEAKHAKLMAAKRKRIRAKLLNPTARRHWKRVLRVRKEIARIERMREALRWAA